jgi:hypothetical protein
MALKVDRNGFKRQAECDAIQIMRIDAGLSPGLEDFSNNEALCFSQ